MCVLENSYLGGGRYFGPRLQVREMQAAVGQGGGLHLHRYCRCVS